MTNKLTEEQKIETLEIAFEAIVSKFILDILKLEKIAGSHISIPYGNIYEGNLTDGRPLTIALNDVLVELNPGKHQPIDLDLRVRNYEI